MTQDELRFPERVLYETEMTVRVTDLNYGNHLGHDRLVGLVHEARVGLLASAGMGEMDVEGRALVIVELKVSYRAEATHGQRLRIAVAPGELRSRSCDLLYRVTDADSGGLVAMARTGLVVIDPATRRPTPVPDSLRELLTAVA